MLSKSYIQKKERVCRSFFVLKNEKQGGVKQKHGDKYGKKGRVKREKQDRKSS